MQFRKGLFKGFSGKFQEKFWLKLKSAGKLRGSEIDVQGIFWEISGEILA